MKRYKALALRTVDMGFIEPHLTNEWGTYDVYLASDVADLERRHREAVEIIREFDALAQHNVARINAFLTEEEA